MNSPRADRITRWVRVASLRVAAAPLVALVLAACATEPGNDELDRRAAEVLQRSFRDQGIARLDRLTQDAAQQACSGAAPPPAEVARKIEAEERDSIRWPADGAWLGNWRDGEKLAQSGRGMTWADAPGAPNGGSCYNCHQLAKAELAYGTLGPSLYRYAASRGVADPADPAALPVLRATWGKLWNSKAYNACSGMPRFGHQGILTPAQLRDLMALLLDPQSPVNR